VTAPDRAKLPIFAIGHRHRLLPLLITLPGTEGDQLPKAVNIEVIVSVKVAPQPIVPDVSPLRASVDDATSALPAADGNRHANVSPDASPNLAGTPAAASRGAERQAWPFPHTGKERDAAEAIASGTQPKKSLLARTKPGKPLFNGVGGRTSMKTPAQGAWTSLLNTPPSAADAR
jgi:hypothetical protein